MTDPIRNVTLSFRCREEWDKFEVVPGGRLCGSCKHIVRDFRDCSAAQLQEALKSGQRVCGRFNARQLNPAFLKVAAVALSMTTISACEQPVLTPANTQDQLKELKGPITDQLVPPDSLELMGDIEMIDDSIAITGVIVSPIEEDSVQNRRK